jgi:hypothetical protein
MEFPTRADLPIVLPCCRTVFAGRLGLRIISEDDTKPFKGVNDITRQEIEACPALTEVANLNCEPYLAEYCGFPGLVKGVSWGHGMMAYSSNLKKFTQVSSSRVIGNKIKFDYGSEEIKEDRADCWEFCVKMCRIDIITPITRNPGIIFPFTLLREDTTKCPVCYDDLSGNTLHCDKAHQICNKCFTLLPSIKKCPMCRDTYKLDMLNRAEDMNGLIVRGTPYFYIPFSMRGGNSFRDYTYSEAMFLGMLKYSSKYNDFDLFRRMLISAFYNYYMNHKDKFSDFNFNIMEQIDYNNRQLKPNDELNFALHSFIQSINEPEICKDISYTNFYMGQYEDIEFNRDLEIIEKENSWNRLKQYPGDRKNILKREIYFRIKLNGSNENELNEYFKNIFYRIAINGNRYRELFNCIDRE